MFFHFLLLLYAEIFQLLWFFHRFTITVHNIFKQNTQVHNATSSKAEIQKKETKFIYLFNFQTTIVVREYKGKGQREWDHEPQDVLFRKPKLEKRKRKYTSEHNRKKNEKYTGNAQILNCERCRHESVERCRGVGTVVWRDNVSDMMGASDNVVGGRNDIRLKSE